MEDAHKCIPQTDIGTHVNTNHEEGKVESQTDSKDDSLAAPKIPESQLKCSGFFGVFDGHGGEKCSEYVADRFADYLFRQSNLVENPDKALNQAFASLEADWCTHAKTHQIDAGTTAIVAVFMGESLYVANVGDSEAVLCRNGVAIEASKPHNMKKNEDEESRIRELGGKVFHKRLGHPALNPQFFSIAVTRAMGDIMYKDPDFTQNKQSGLIAVPEIIKFTRESTDQFLIVACDGLWDVVSQQEACKFVLDRVSSKKGDQISWQQITEDLANQAFEKGSTDNITVLIVGFV